MMSNRGRLCADPGPGRFVSRHECRFVSRLSAGEVGVVRQVVDQLADRETVVELGRHGDVTSAALSRVGPGQRRGSSFDSVVMRPGSISHFASVGRSLSRTPCSRTRSPTRIESP
jgi:hypothetical protein